MTVLDYNLLNPPARTYGLEDTGRWRGTDQAVELGPVKELHPVLIYWEVSLHKFREIIFSPNT